MNLSTDTICSILRGAEYISEGTPLKDAMDTCEVEEAVLYLSELIKADVKSGKIRLELNDEEDEFIQQVLEAI
jgi:hypothetical protein